MRMGQEAPGTSGPRLRTNPVQTALAESKSFVYAFDLSSWRMVVDFLAKLLVVTAVFADLVLRATVTAWRNDRSLRARHAFFTP